MKNPSERKSDRLGEIEQLLLAHPEGLKQAEIARRLGVSRSTITRYLPNLPGSAYIDDMDDNKWKVDRQAYLINVRFTLDEAMAIHLATRLLATRMERQNPYAASALRKLGIALNKLAPRISQHLRQSADAMDNPAQRQDPSFLHSLEVITQAWALQHQVHLWYWSEKGELKEHDFAPYFIEPYAIGQSIYAIGWANPPDALRTLKVDRIKRIEQGKEMYEIPDSFDPAILLKDAWGIWYTGEEPVEVVLKFSQRVARRVKETRWHRSERSPRWMMASCSGAPG